MGRTKSRPRPLKKNRNKFLGLGLPTPRQRLERCNIYKLCVTKLARIADPGAKLCKAVLINNTLRRLETQPEQYEYTTPQENISCEHKNICTDYTAEEEEEEVEEEEKNLDEIGTEATNCLTVRSISCGSSGGGNEYSITWGNTEQTEILT